VSTIIKNKYEVWQEDVEVGRRGDFLVRARIDYPETSYECWAGFWNTLKWAWIQYFAIFIVVVSVLKKFQQVVYRSRMFESMLEVPWERKYGLKPSAYSK
jgi:hypothetical protein